MILECSQCHSRYVVPDSAIGPAGRTVRCANCKHSWHQAGTALDLVARAQSASAAAAIAPPPAAPSPAAPSPPPPASPAAPAPSASDATSATSGADYDAFAHHAPFRPRRNPARRWTMAAAAAGIAMLAATGAILYSGAPGIASRLGLSIGARETPLLLSHNPIERRDLASGSELFAISGKVVNPTDTRQPVPDIRAELRDAQGRIVYGWTIRPEAMVLPAHATVEFNSAKLDVPVNSKDLYLSFSGETAR